MKPLLLFVVGLATLLRAQSGPAVAPAMLVFTNVNVVNVRQGTIDHNVMVTIKNGRIESVARVGLIGDPHGMQVLNGAGKFLVPGLWDMHVHSALNPVWDEKLLYPLYIANGITGVRDMGGDPDLLEKRRSAIDRGELLGPHIVMVGPFLAGGKSDSTLINIDKPEDARQAVDALKKRGVDFIKILSNISRESYFAVAEESARQQIHFVGHVPDAVSVWDASAAGQYSIEHLTGISMACSASENDLRQAKLTARASRDYAVYPAIQAKVLDSYDPGKASRLFALLIKNHTWQVPTLVWTQANANLDDPQLLSDPRLRYVPKSVQESWDPRKALAQATPEDLKLVKAEMARDVELVKSMQAAGVPMLAGSDGPDPFVFPGFSLHDELKMLVKGGLTPLQALQSATSSAALFLGKSGEYGYVEKGYAADLVLLDANPLEDIANTQRITAVVVGGKYHPREELDRILAHAAELANTE